MEERRQREQRTTSDLRMKQTHQSAQFDNAPPAEADREKRKELQSELNVILGRYGLQGLVDVSNTSLRVVIF